MGTVRVLIADDHALFAKTLEAILSGTPGIEVVGIAEDGLGLGIPVVVLTASADPKHAQQAHEAGAKGYLTKDRIATALVPAVLDVAGAPARLSDDGGAELAGRARIV